jgi:hypothetical protein
MFWMQSASAAGGIDGTDLELTFCKVFYGGWATLPLYPNERISFYGCQTLRFLKGPGLDAASLLNFCGNHGFMSGHGRTGIPPTHQHLLTCTERSECALRACPPQEGRQCRFEGHLKPAPSKTEGVGHAPSQKASVPVT